MNPNTSIAQEYFHSGIGKRGKCWVLNMHSSNVLKIKINTQFNLIWSICFFPVANSQKLFLIDLFCFWKLLTRAIESTWCWLDVVNGTKCWSFCNIARENGNLLEQEYFFRGEGKPWFRNRPFLWPLRGMQMKALAVEIVFWYSRAYPMWFAFPEKFLL